MKSKSILQRNIYSSILPQFVNILSNFILPTMIIVAYGSQVNGLVSTIRTIISYVALVGAGIATATTQALYAPVANSNTEEVKGMLKAADNMFNHWGYIYLLLVSFISLLYPFLIESDIDYLTMVSLLLVMSVSGASEFFIVGRCRSLLYANQKVYVCSQIQALSLFISLLFAVVLLKLEVNIILVQLSISFVYILRAILLRWYVNKEYPEFVNLKNVAPIKKATEKRKDAMLHQLTGLVVTSSQTVILSMMVGLEAASIFAVYNIIFSGIYSICSNINVAVTPFLGKVFAVGTLKQVYEKYQLCEISFYLICSFVFGVTVFVILPFVALYTQHADINYIYHDFAILFVIVQFFSIYRLPSNALINVAGHYKETRLRAIIEALICFVSSIIFTYLYGMYGVLLGTGCAIGWRCLDIIFYSHHILLHVSVKKSLFRFLRCLIIIIISYFISNRIEITISSYLSWILYSICISIFISVILFLDVSLFERQMLQRIRLSSQK